MSEHKITATPFDFGRLAREETFQATLEPSDPRHKRMFTIDAAEQELSLYWAGHCSSFSLEWVKTPKDLLWFLEHILAHDWPHTTGQRVALLIRAIVQHYGWNLYERAPEVRTTSAAQERAKLTPSLRYDVLLRDDFRCRVCGFSVESGAHLHVDHIKPVSRGGVTELSNLQALCSVCNMGKGAK